MKKNLIYLVLLAGIFFNTKAQSLFSDSFESNSLANWTTTPLSGVYGIWSTTNTMLNPSANITHGSYAAQFNCYNAPAGNSTRLALLNSLDFSITTEVPRLKFYMFHDNDFSTYKDSIKVRWSIDGGLNWSDGMTGFARYTASNNSWQEHIVILTGTQSQANVKICFDGVSAYGNNMFIDDISIHLPEPMLWNSCTAFQSNTLPVIPGSLKNQILDIQLKTDNDLNPVTVNSFEFNATSSTAAGSDIQKIQLWSNSNLGYSDFASANTQIGADITTGLDGNFTITPTTPLALVSGVNHFWLTFDVPPSAQTGNVLDAQFIKVTTNSKVEHLPVISSPAGNRTIKNALNGSFTIDPSGSGSSNYSSFTQAINDLNTLGVSGAVTFNVAANNLFDEVPPAIVASGSGSNAIIFQKSGTGTNPKIQGTGNGLADCGIWIKGGDYITFDGIDVEDKATNLTATERIEYGYYITNISATDGSQHNTIKNANITLNRQNALSVGIVSANKVAPTDINGTNSYNKFYNIKIDNAGQGIQFSAINSAVSNEGNEIGTVNGGYNEIGGNAGIGAATGVVCGISIPLGEKDLKIFNTVVKNISSEASSAYGIYLLQLKGISNIYNNKIYNISALSTGTGKIATGVNVGAAITHTANIYNNMIFGINYNPASPLAAASVRGLNVNAISTLKGAVNIYHNTIVLETSENTTSRVVDVAYGDIVLKNNILVNSTPNQTSAKHYGIYKGNLVTSFTSDYNDIVIPNSANGFTGFYTTDKVLLSDWQASFSALDANSINLNPSFVSPTDLHLQFIEANSPFNNTAPGIPLVSQDIDSDVRGAMTDMGCDEILDPSNISNNLPDGITLEQNYPNPFNPETTINFSLSSNCLVKLTVYNIKGEVVKELINQTLNSGKHSIKYNATGVNSGVYFYKLTTPERSITQKMLLCK